MKMLFINILFHALLLILSPIIFPVFLFVLFFIWIVETYDTDRDKVWLVLIVNKLVN